MTYRSEWGIEGVRHNPVRHMELPPSRIVTSLHDIDYSAMRLPMLTVYIHPKDFPEKFVVRLFDLDKPTNIVLLADTLEEARARIPQHWFRLARDPHDDPRIVEVYV